uniref:CD24 n=1 Tax=Equus asinus TaxID=9793 RepID=A0A8C4N215_EQUAS
MNCEKRWWPGSKLGLLLLVLLLPTQIYSNQTTIATTSSRSSQSTLASPNPANATPKTSGGALQSTASLFVILFSLLHLTVKRLRPRNVYTSPSSKSNPSGV